MLLPSLSVEALWIRGDAWIVVSSGQVVSSFQRLLGSEVKLSPVCCCLTDTHTLSPSSLIVSYKLSTSSIKESWRRVKKNNEMRSGLDLICWLRESERKHANKQDNAWTPFLKNIFQGRMHACVLALDEWHKQLLTWSLKPPGKLINKDWSNVPGISVTFKGVQQMGE